MAVFNVKNICETTRSKLSEAIAKLEQFLNAYSLQQLNTENDQAMDECNYSGTQIDTTQIGGAEHPDGK